MQYCLKGKSLKPGYQNPYKSHRLTSVQNLFLNQEVPILLKERQLYPVFLCGHLVFIFFFLPHWRHILFVLSSIYTGQEKKSAESSLLFHILTASEKQLSSKNKTPIKKDVLGANIEKQSLICTIEGSISISIKANFLAKKLAALLQNHCLEIYRILYIFLKGSL